jgi:PAS domain S-box-containing protein
VLASLGAVGPAAAFPKIGPVPPFLVASGIVIAALGLVFSLNIILVKRARQAEAADARSRDILDLVPEGVLILDGEGKIISANPQAERVFGYRAADLIGQPLSLLLPHRLPELPPRAADKGRTAAAGPAAIVKGEFSGRRRDGAEITLEIHVKPSQSAPGKQRILVLWDISERKKTEESLRTKEAHLQLVVDQMPAILWTTDRELHITSSAGGGLASMNLQPDEVIGMSMVDYLERDDTESTAIAAHLRALRGESLSYEMTWRERTFQVRVDPLRNADKRITGTIGILVDVTDRKQTMVELRSRAQQQAAIAELGQKALSGIGLDALMHQATSLVTATLDVEFCRVSEALADGKAFRPRAGAGWQTAQGAPPLVDDVCESEASYCVFVGEPVVAEHLPSETRFRASKLLCDHKVVSCVTAIIHGKRRPYGVLGAYTSQARKFTDDDVHFLQAVANVLASSIERKESEEAQVRLVAILEATTDVVAMAGPDQGLLYVNRAGRDFLGLSAEENVGAKTIADLHPEKERRRFFKERIPRAIRKGVWSGETLLLGKGGREVPVSQLLLAHKSPTGAVKFLSTIARDVSERLRLEEQFHQAQKMQAIGQLAGGVAHDFNNLLCVIIGCSDVLLGGLPGDDKRHSYVQEIKKAGERAASLTRQLLAFSRKQMLMPCILNLNGLVTNLDQLLRRLLGEDIELVTVLDPALHPVKADPGQMEQILMNLAVNSRDAMPQGGKLTITSSNIELEENYTREHAEVRPGLYVQLAVSDTGCGMSEEILARIFEPFFTTKEVGKGTGLGLATVYGIVKQSGGHIEVASTPAQGSTFKVYLPGAGGRTHSPPDATVRPDVPGGTETVLLVEDEERVRALSRQVLQDNGYQVLEARDGLEALALSEAHAGPIHLLLTDVVMPRLSGSALAERLMPLRPEMKLLFVSGFTESALVRNGVLTGEVECLLKPFTIDILARKVREVLDGTEPSFSRPALAAPNAATLPSHGLPADSERRLVQRVHPAEQTRLECTENTLGWGANLAEALLDISLDGAGIMLKSSVKPGQEVEVVLGIRGPGDTIKVPAEVIWLTATANGRFRTGVRFRRRLNPLEFQRLV